MQMMKRRRMMMSQAQMKTSIKLFLRHLKIIYIRNKP